ncbi:MAG: hypothetical protein KatS3mg044_0834 [Rhodothermaceae bacterium]|nr:MAG: hypothetical protein KatS3mg044_0834 [Rhodothermaceae bacterium]
MKQGMNWLRGGLVTALLLAFVLVGCDTTQTVTDDEPVQATTATPEAALQADLQLTDEQVQTIRQVLAGQPAEVREPGALWTVAARLHATLTETQRARLQEWMARARDEASDAPDARRPGRRGQRGPGMKPERGARPEHGFRGPNLPSLTDEQREALEALHTSFREKMEALREQLAAGTLTREAFDEQREALREQHREDVAAILTDEQRAALEEARQDRLERFREHREEALAARAEALGLTEAQQAALEALAEQHRQEHEALRAAVRDGTLDREAFHERLQALRAAHRDQMAEILTEEQQEIVALHHLLARRMMRPRDGHAGADRPGFRRGGPRR